MKSSLIPNRPQDTRAESLGYSTKRLLVGSSINFKVGVEFSKSLFSIVLSINLRINYARPERLKICFSIHVDKNINKLSDYFGARLSAGDSLRLQSLLEIQSHMDSAQFDLLCGIKHSAKKRSMPFKIPNDDGKIFSNYFTNIIVDENDERKILPMRYRVRPHGSRAEVPAKYNVFNARIDSLEMRNTWVPLFMRNHGLVPMSGFYEWVQGDEGKPRLIHFYPEAKELMWAPCLWDEWVSKDGQIQFKSFAIITDGPPPEIEKMGHDRCPIFLGKEQIDFWLNPKDKKKEEMYSILKIKEPVNFLYKWVD